MQAVYVARFSNALIAPDNYCSKSTCMPNETDHSTPSDFMERFFWRSLISYSEVSF
jgi:hypothetical protein